MNRRKLYHYQKIDILERDRESNNTSTGYVRWYQHRKATDKISKIEEEPVKIHTEKELAWPLMAYDDVNKKEALSEEFLHN